MKRTGLKVTKEFIKDKTDLQKRRLKKHMDKLNAVANDTSKDERLLKSLCKSCFYFPEVRIVMHAFCEQDCGICNTPQRYHNSNTDAICLDCAKKKELCKKCGCEREY